MKEKIIIFDTTLRDGEQSLKSSLNTKEKIEIALALEEMKIDVIEVGFPISSPGDFKSVQEISKNIKKSTICSLARCVEKDIKIAAKAMSKLENFRIHLFLGTSKLHIESKLRKNFKDIQKMAIKSIKIAKKYTDDIEFSCEDAGRTSIDNLCKIVELLIKNGVKTINIPDTVGYTIPNEFSKIIKTLYQRVPNIDKTIISVHCHNDLGMAVGNSISAIQAGARQIEGTITGVGERAGNTALEEIIMAIKTRQKLLNFFTQINHKKIYRTSKIISKICNISIPVNKAIIGKNAFSHSSGIHQDGIIKNRKNYEIISPKEIGLKNKKFNLTSRSGRAAVKQRMKEMGYKKKYYNLTKLYKNFLKLADKKGQIFDYDLESLAFKKSKKFKKNYFILKKFKITFKNKNKTKIYINILCGKKIKKYINKTKNEIINEICKGLNKITKINVKLNNFKIISIIKNKNLLEKINICMKYKKKKFYATKINKNINKTIIKIMLKIYNTIWNSKKIKKITKKYKIK
ncbi:MAG: 2-isopropylmalate synthase [Buchnera aphidicola (Periphyllus lyropictus)]|uniref:2-isopropylmalate synthase n=1 Tax=Buchnera aphidicola TaxID=9 RepID=UPI001EC8C7D4|nr:2-isopropylmalate synthase [Buchnera aphidicola]NIH16723.1 2-isopropylmalate synthase [Buchnera aphidicola (Periphyllus lyropictus)]USS94628.1 2-isopropylmalate synthase [Buchnera aphidicola (Periphyllus lyropictus)]